MTFGAANLIHVGKSLLRYWGVTLLNVLGLATGFAAAIIIGLYVRNELGFDRFLPDADRVLMLTTVYSLPNSPLVSNDKSPAGMRSWLSADAPEVDSMARLCPVEWSVRSPRFQSLEYMYWTDANFFDLLRVRAVYGDLKTALSQPYSMVLTQRMARRYFGQENVVGQTLLINGGSPVTVTAVLADFPANTSLDREIYISGSSSYSMLTILDAHPDWQWSSSYTFMRLKPGMHLSTDRVRAIAADHWHNTYNLPVKFNLTPLPQVHFQPEADSPMAPRGHMDTVVAMVAVAGVILLLAAVNFAGMMTAQIDERRGEMAIRSSLGAQRQSLFLHVFCEAAVITGLATLFALALVEKLLPVINPVLGLKLSLWASPPFTLCFALAAILTGLSGGLYPAAALSAVQPGQGGRSTAGKARPYLGRVGWITMQFALLITLLISSQIVYRQWAFATGPSLNFDGARVVQISVYDRGGQDASFKQHLLALNSVTAASYSRFLPDDRDIRPGWATSPSGQTIQFERQSVDTDFFHMFGVPLLAGRNFSGVYHVNTSPGEIILSRSAALALGYARPADAVGQTLSYIGDHAPIRSKIIGVVGDMRVGSIREPLQPMVFDNQSFFFTRLNVKLRPGSEAAGVAAIDRVWKQDYPENNPIERHFYAEHLTSLYYDMNQQWWAYGLLSFVGLCLSVMGLSGLSIYLARTRQREIAIRNALGARWWDIVLLRLEPFVKPLLAANVIAALASSVVMSLWLDAFTAHIALDIMPFLYAGGATILITVAVLTAHSLMNAPARSSQPLRAD